jgi:hypothetical protein
MNLRPLTRPTLTANALVGVLFPAIVLCSIIYAFDQKELDIQMEA